MCASRDTVSSSKSRSVTALSMDGQWEEIDECSLKKSESNILRKYSLNQKTQKFMSNFSKMSVPQFLKKSMTRKSKNEDIPNTRPVSMYNEHSPEVAQYVQNNNLLIALRDAELRFLESEKHKINLESKVKSLEKEIEFLQNENQQQIVRERALMLQIQEFERRNQTKDAECQERSLNARIREMELSSEIATLSQRLATLDTENQERQIHKIMESQNRIMEQTLPYTMSAENIYDNEDGLFNNQLFEEMVKEQSQVLKKDSQDSRRSSKKSDDFRFQDPDDYASSRD